MTSLNMAGNGLTGTLPELPDSSVLQNISLSDNHFTGTIPLSMQQKGTFTLFDLSNNKVQQPSLTQAHTHSHTHLHLNTHMSTPHTRTHTLP